MMFIARIIGVLWVILCSIDASRADANTPASPILWHPDNTELHQQLMDLSQRKAVWSIAQDKSTIYIKLEQKALSVSLPTRLVLIWQGVNGESSKRATISVQQLPLTLNTMIDRGFFIAAVDAPIIIKAYSNDHHRNIPLTLASFRWFKDQERLSFTINENRHNDDPGTLVNLLYRYPVNAIWSKDPVILVTFLNAQGQQLKTQTIHLANASVNHLAVKERLVETHSSFFYLPPSVSQLTIHSPKETDIALYRAKNPLAFYVSSTYDDLDNWQELVANNSNGGGKIIYGAIGQPSICDDCSDLSIARTPPDTVLLAPSGSSPSGSSPHDHFARVYRIPTNTPLTVNTWNHGFSAPSLVMNNTESFVSPIALFINDDLVLEHSLSRGHHHIPLPILEPNHYSFLVKAHDLKYAYIKGADLGDQYPAFYINNGYSLDKTDLSFALTKAPLTADHYVSVMGHLYLTQPCMTDLVIGIEPWKSITPSFALLNSWGYQRYVIKVKSTPVHTTIDASNGARIDYQARFSLKLPTGNISQSSILSVNSNENVKGYLALFTDNKRNE